MVDQPDPRALITAHDDVALKLEEAAAQAASARLSTAVDALFGRLIRRWATVFGRPRVEATGPTYDALVDELTAAIQLLPVDSRGVLTEYAQRARRLGVDQGSKEAGASPRVSTDLREETVQAIEASERRAREKLAQASTLLRSTKAATLAQMQQQLSPVHQAPAILERTARTVANEELNEGIAAVARETGARLVWVAERDACVTCLALSGHVVDPGTAFDWRLTFGDKAQQPKAYDANGNLVAVQLLRPPRHPNCRCRVSPWRGHDTEGALSVTHDWANAIKEAEAKGDTVAADAARKAAQAAADSASFDLPAALRREAERSVLNGYALPSESERVREQAADRLLKRIGSGKNSPSPSGWRVPASVKTKTRRRIKGGTFTTGPVPGH